MRKKYILLLLVIIISSQYLKSQFLGKYTYPTPNTNEILKYSQIPVNLFNGLPDINIPVYTLKAGDLEVPLSLTYYAGGNKPDEHPGWTGLGWSLAGSGAISRNVNGRRDDLTLVDLRKEINNSPVDLKSDPGYYYNMKNIASTEWNEYNLVTQYGPEDVYWPEAYANFYFDTEPDEFIFKAPGLS